MAFKPNALVAAELAEEAAMQELTKTRAEEAKSHAEAIAPRGATGNYADSFVLVKTARGWDVGNTDFAAHFVEWGSINNPAYAVLRRAVTAVGLHLRESPKP